MLNSDHAYRFINKVDLIDIGFFILSILVIALFVKGIKNISDWVSKKFPSKRMIIFGWVPILNFLICIIGISEAFYVIFDPSREFLMAFAISILIAIIFSLKDVGTSIMGGVILLLDKPFQVGDRVNFQGHYGEIVKIGLRSVKLLTLDESVVTIPNNLFINDVVSSSNAGELGMMVTVDVYVSPESDLHKIKEILQHETQKSQYVDPKGKILIVCKEILGLNGTVSFAITVKCIIKDARLKKHFKQIF